MNLNAFEYDFLDVARFWSKVKVTRNDDACWIWARGKYSAGYGSFRLRSGAVVSTHRLAYAIANGIRLDAISDDVMRHSCDTPACCNPIHLSAGTHADNVADRVARNRSAKGEGNGHHVLTEDQVRAIMADPRSNSAISRDYEVHVDTVRCIKIGKTWRHLFTETHPDAAEVTTPLVP